MYLVAVAWHSPDNCSERVLDSMPNCRVVVCNVHTQGERQDEIYPLTSRPRYVIGDRDGRMPPKAIYERDPSEGSGKLATLEAGTITGLLGEYCTRL